MFDFFRTITCALTSMPKNMTSLSFGGKIPPMHHWDDSRSGAFCTKVLALPFERKVSWFVAAKPSTWKKQLAIGEAIEGKAGEAIKGMVAVKRQLEHAKASARCAIEWSFHWIKNIYGYSKTRYRGIAKNHSRTVMLCSLYKEALQKYPEQSFA